MAVARIGQIAAFLALVLLLVFGVMSPLTFVIFNLLLILQIAWEHRHAAR
ncbi:MAG: hypothetical protein JWM60_869 [Solirubrobacterales bacterium]|nr:hypothetical protein [Solirubrobacterales bacterium]